MAGESSVEASVAALLKPLGFRRHRSTWHLLRAETVLVLNLQKSAFGAIFYANLGVYFRALGSETTPPEYRCHLRTRLDRLCPDPSALLVALDLESSLDSPQRDAALRHHILSVAIPWLQARETEAKARAALLAEPQPTGLVTLAAKAHLGITGAA
jgi:hypothetical protein